MTQKKLQTSLEYKSFKNWKLFFHPSQPKTQFFILHLINFSFSQELFIPKCDIYAFKWLRAKTICINLISLLITFGYFYSIQQVNHFYQLFAFDEHKECVNNLIRGDKGAKVYWNMIFHTMLPCVHRDNVLGIFPLNKSLEGWTKK